MRLLQIEHSSVTEVAEYSTNDSTNVKIMLIDITSSSAMTRRPRELDQRFQVGVNLSLL